MFGLFRNRRKQLMGRMLGMASAGRVSAALALGEHFKARGDDANLAARKSAAVSNWIFEGTVADEHVQLFADIEAEAMVRLRANPGLRELAVQTLRVEAIVRHGLGHDATGPMQVLTEFGRSYPDAPDPDTYDDLLMRFSRTLSPEAQRSLSRWIESRFGSQRNT